MDLTSDGISFTAADGDVLVHGTTTVAFADGTSTTAHDAEFAALIDQVVLDPSILDSSHTTADATASSDPFHSTDVATVTSDTLHATDVATAVDTFLATEPVTDTHLATYTQDVALTTDTTTHDTTTTTDPVVHDTSTTTTDTTVYDPTHDTTVYDPTHDTAVHDTVTYDHVV